MKDFQTFSNGVEREADHESQLIEEILEEMAETQQVNSEKYQHAARDAHAKSHAVLKASLTGDEGPPRRIAQRTFATPRRYDVVVRMSSSPGDIHSERVPAPPGFAITIIGVDGERLLPGLKSGNQDFPMVSFPTLAFGTIEQYKQMLPLPEKNAQSPEVLQKLVAGTGILTRKAPEGVGAEPSATLEGVGRDNSQVLGEAYYTQAAVRYGNYVAKISLVPRSDNVWALTDRGMDVNDSSSISDLVVDHFRTESAEYEPDAQLCVDLDTMPVEDAAVLWDENALPHQSIATLRLESQDAYGAARPRLQRRSSDIQPVGRRPCAPAARIDHARPEGRVREVDRLPPLGECASSCGT